MKNKTMAKNFTLILILSITGVNTILAKSEHTADEKCNITFATNQSKEETEHAREWLTTLKHPENIQKKCDEKQQADACYVYAGYLDLIRDNRKKSYSYHIKAFNLGKKESGVFIGNTHINYPEVFADNEQPSIEETIYYLEQAFQAELPEATQLLMRIYRLPKFDRVDYKKSEYYNKIAIEQGVHNSRLSLAGLYLHDMKDFTKVDESIALLQEDLRMERNLLSAFVLMGLYLYPDRFGNTIEQDYIKGLAYAYITRDLRKEDPDNTTPRVEEKVIATMESEFPQQTLDQANAVYQQIKAEMGEAGTNH